MFRPKLAIITKILFEFLSKDPITLQLSTQRPIHDLYILYFVGKYTITFVGVCAQNMLQQ
jgi:hypothetical protein